MIKGPMKCSMLRGFKSESGVNIGAENRSSWAFASKPDWWCSRMCLLIDSFQIDFFCTAHVVKYGFIVSLLKCTFGRFLNFGSVFTVSYITNWAAMRQVFSFVAANKKLLSFDYLLFAIINTFSVGQCVAMSRPTLNNYHLLLIRQSSNQTKPQRWEVSWDPGRIVNWN